METNFFWRTDLIGICQVKRFISRKINIKSGVPPKKKKKKKRSSPVQLHISRLAIAEIYPTLPASTVLTFFFFLFWRSPQIFHFSPNSSPNRYFSIYSFKFNFFKRHAIYPQCLRDRRNEHPWFRGSTQCRKLLLDFNLDGEGWWLNNI